MEIVEVIVFYVVFGSVALFFRMWREKLWEEHLEDLRDHSDEWKGRYEW